MLYVVAIIDMRQNISVMLKIFIKTEIRDTSWHSWHFAKTFKGNISSQQRRLFQITVIIFKNYFPRIADSLKSLCKLCHTIYWVQNLALGLFSERH